MEGLIFISLCSIVYLFYLVYTKSRDDEDSTSDIELEENNTAFTYKSYYDAI